MLASRSASVLLPPSACPPRAQQLAASSAMKSVSSPRDVTRVRAPRSRRRRRASRCPFCNFVGSLFQHLLGSTVPAPVNEANVNVSANNDDDEPGCFPGQRGHQIVRGTEGHRVGSTPRGLFFVFLFKFSKCQLLLAFLAFLEHSDQEVRFWLKSNP